MMLPHMRDPLRTEAVLKKYLPDFSFGCLEVFALLAPTFVKEDLEGCVNVILLKCR